MDMEKSKSLKKVSIITIIDNVNFGTYLQALALAKAIEDLGFSPHIIDYCRKHQSFSYLLQSNIASTCNPLKWIYRTYNWYKSMQLRKKDKHFLEKYLTTKKYFSFNELVQNPPQADIYVTGSDQVWNSSYNKGIDKAFYLDFVPKQKPRIAYAASIGMECIPESEKQVMAKLLSKYQAISVRETKAEQLLNELNLSIKPTTVLDPTLLLNKKAWENYACKRLIHEPYAVVYSVETKAQDKLISKMANIISQNKGLKIVGIYYGGKKNKIKNTDCDFFRVTPSVFLSLFYHADYCIVSSFHGTAFSINFQKDFLTITPKKFNSRVDNLLTLCNLKDRLVINEKYNIQNALGSIDYTSVNQHIEEARKHSFNYLKQALLS